MPKRLAAIYVRAAGSSKRIRLAALALIAAAGAAALVAQPHKRPQAAPMSLEQLPASGASPAAPLLVQANSPAAAAPAARRIYPYSIIPGGAATREELAQAIKTDKVVAGHYAGFDVAKAHQVVVAKPRAVYVSYRKGDQVFWTSKKLMLAEGETLLSDGVNEMRTRCANRISDTPQLPVAEREPSAAELDTPVVEEGSVQQISADGIEDSGFDGQPFQLQSFADGAGLALADATPASTSGFRFSTGGSPLSQPSSVAGSGGTSRTVVARDPGAGDTPGTSTTQPAPGTDSSDPESPPKPDTSSPNPGVPKPSTGGEESPNPEPESNPEPNPQPGVDPKPDPEPFIPPPPLGPPELPHGGEDQTGPSKVPEPGTLWLGALAGAAMLLLRRTRPSRR